MACQVLIVVRHATGDLSGHGPGDHATTCVEISLMGREVGFVTIHW